MKEANQAVTQANRVIVMMTMIITMKKINQAVINRKKNNKNAKI